MVPKLMVEIVDFPSDLDFVGVSYQIDFVFLKKVAVNFDNLNPKR
jgi:hypothetical protein